VTLTGLREPDDLVMLFSDIQATTDMTVRPAGGAARRPGRVFTLLRGRWFPAAIASRPFRVPGSCIRQNAPSSNACGPSRRLSRLSQAIRSRSKCPSSASGRYGSVRSCCQHQTTFSVGIYHLQAEGYSRRVPAQIMDLVGDRDYASAQIPLAADFLPAPDLSSCIRRMRWTCLPAVGSPSGRRQCDRSHTLNERLPNHRP